MVSDKNLSRMEERIDEFRMRIKDSSQREVFADVFDTATLMALYELSKKSYITAMGGSVSTGKEANIFHAISKKDDAPEIAVKIYMISTANFNAMKDYILGDPRFSGIKQTRKDIILAWAKKEFKNLKRAEDAGVRVPKPYITRRNILLMEFIGKDGVPMPQLKDVKLTQKEAQRIFNRIVEYMALLYSRARLVHADLSEYNILIDMNNMEPVIIDMGQSVMIDHFNAEKFLRRDVDNIAHFFKKLNIPVNEERMISIIKEEV
ncbi:serine/threonine protein kinase involved in cell cycle control [Candidatus Methanoperedens nitroreducens]|uniref:non-specific serine/threonine protein kinase n=1 Tax=Candidatus Methanoperedens nitratireducens TaxID=1392998 RepID=A0A062V3U1_9EURY|nr:serine protein kinase RIO [Candidatus Methanoperedens nitroreducens]KCZ71997.1 serine/threonine protein kinase involved in cell cycle control [Candidatus Methanoperedens nitroreducens]MDJ1422027.1 serine protein kinase RIO [Candidatus Methanoperedens sp.]